MSLVSGYSTGAYYPGSLSHEFYPQSATTMGVSRYQWHHPHHHNVTQIDANTHDMSHTASWMTTHPNLHNSHHHDGLSNHLEHSLIGLNGTESYPQGYGIAHDYSNMHNMYNVVDNGQIKVRVVKRKVSANKKERRRTISINTAFSALRGCIPNVPTDTKLSKIKTLRLATSYIAYLMDVLNKDDPNMAEAFKAELTKKTETAEERRKKEAEEMLRAANKEDRRSKGRTGWPQTVWASELKTTDQVSATSSSGNSSSGEQDMDT